MKNLFILIPALLVISCSDKYSENINQDFEIFKINNKYIARGEIDFKEHISGTDAGEVIQYALNNLGKFGGNVYIHSGIYKLNKQINVPAHSTLSGSGNATKLIFEENHSTGIAVSCKGVDKAIVKDIFIKAELDNISAKIGVLVDSCGDSYVEDVSCIGMQDHGIVLSNNSFLCEIRGCKVGGTGKSGILIKKLDKGGRGGDWVPSLISNCIVYACGKGIECQRSLVVNIIGCQVYQTKSHGFHIHSVSNSVIISGCRTFQITGNAVNVDKSHEINISSNIFCWHTEEGIVLDDVTWGTISGNNVIDNGSINLFDPDEDPYIKTDPERPHTKKPSDLKNIPIYNGIYLKNETKGLTVTGNAIFNWPAVPPMKYGIEEDATCFSNNITSNNINFCKEGDISAKGDKTNVEANCSFIDQPYLGKASRMRHFFDPRLMEEFIHEVNMSF